MTMSTAVTPTTLSTTAPQTSATPRLRITARGRAVLTGVVALPFVAIIGILALNGGGAVANGESPRPLESITVLSGQSLWEVAEDLAPEEDPREVIADFVAVNTLASAEVRPGQQLDIPREYSN
jgi:hypothetical protein